MTDPRSEARANAMRLAREDADHLCLIADEAEENGWMQWGADMRQASSRIMELLAFAEPAAAMPGLPSREALARALHFDHVDQHGYPNGLPTWDEMPDAIARSITTTAREYWLSLADAALALRTPSQSGETGEVERLREVLEGIRDHARVRIQDGKDMGAAVWRIALEDVDREATAALKTSPDDGGLSFPAEENQSQTSKEK